MVTQLLRLVRLVLSVYLTGADDMRIRVNPVFAGQGLDRCAIVQADDETGPSLFPSSPFTLER